MRELKSRDKNSIFLISCKYQEPLQLILEKILKDLLKMSLTVMFLLAYGLLFLTNIPKHASLMNLVLAIRNHSRDNEQILILEVKIS